MMSWYCFVQGKINKIKCRTTMKVKFCKSWRITNVKELVRHDMNVNEHERLLNITLGHKLK